MTRHTPRTLRARRRKDILACAPGILIAHHGLDSCGQIARHLGLSRSGLRAHVSNEAELVRLLCHAHLDALFHAVCQHTTRQIRPNPLAAMAAALLETASAQPARHSIYLLHRFMLPATQLQALEARRALIDNAFHFTLHAIMPERPFAALRASARLIVGQLLHTPLWCPGDACARITC